MNLTRMFFFELLQKLHRLILKLMTLLGQYKISRAIITRLMMFAHVQSLVLHFAV